MFVFQLTSYGVALHFRTGGGTNIDTDYANKTLSNFWNRELQYVTEENIQKDKGQKYNLSNLAYQAIYNKNNDNRRLLLSLIYKSRLEYITKKAPVLK